MRQESEETGEGHIQRRYRYILIEELWVLGSYTDRQLRQCTADRTIIHTDREKSPHLMMTGRGGAQCCGSASIIMRIRIQDPKNVHMDPDPRG